MSDFFFWLIFLVSSPPSLRFSHSSSMNTILGESSKFPMSSIPSSSSSTITNFSEGLSSSMLAEFFENKLEK